MGLRRWLANRITAWLVRDIEPSGLPLSDFDRLSFEIRPCDVLLVEGRSRVSRVIKAITQSAWTHTALYIGRISDLEDPTLRALIARHYNGDQRDRVVIEALLGEGTVINPLDKYAEEHLRICRPKGLSVADAQHVIEYTARHLGTDYDVRQLLDLARLLAPYTVLPRKWRSTLLEHNPGIPTRTVCSSMIAAAFTHVRFPILPVMRHTGEGRLRLYQRNTRLFTPRDFDYSPYFDIIKYPLLGFNELGLYRQLPWDEEGVICNDAQDCFLPQPPAPPTLSMAGVQRAAMADEEPDA